MTTFHFVAINEEGHKISGEADAANESELHENLSRIGLRLLSIREEGWFARWCSSFSLQDRIILCQHLFLTFRAGITPREAMDSAREALPPSALRYALLRVAAALNAGKGLADAFAVVPHLFDRYALSLVKAAELTGMLAYGFEQLGRYYQRRYNLRRQLLQALRYPVTATVFTSGLLWVLSAHLFELFVHGSFTLSPEKLKIVSKITPGFVINYWLPLFIVLSLVWLCLHIAYKRQSIVALWCDHLLISVPWLGRLLGMIEWSRYSAMLALLYHCGIEFRESVSIACGAVTNRAIAIQAKQFNDLVQGGLAPAHAATLVEGFPHPILQSFIQGEKTGYFDETLENVYGFYDRYVTDALDAFILHARISMFIIAGLLLQCSIIL